MERGYVAMSDLIAISFQEPALAFEMRAALTRMQRDFLIEMDDVVVVTKDGRGRVKLHQRVNLMAMGAMGGGFWGMLIGILFLNPLLGVALGAGAGALFGRFSDIGVDDRLMKELATGFLPGHAAIFVQVRKATWDKVLDGLREFHGKGRLLQTSLTKDEAARMREWLGTGLPE